MATTSTYPLSKIVVNSSFGKLTQLPDFSEKGLVEVRNSFAAVAGQKPQDRPAKKSIAGFKLREGTVVGLRSTLRRKKMMQFLDKVNHIVMPRIRDFKGISLDNVDEHGNLTFGIKEHTVFPEIVLENVRFNFGVQITLVPKGNLTRDEAIALYRKLGVPLQKETK